MASDRSLGHQWGKERENMGLVQHLSLGVLQDPENNFGPGHSCYGPTSPCHSPAFLLLAALRNEGGPQEWEPHDQRHEAQSLQVFHTLKVYPLCSQEPHLSLLSLVGFVVLL